MSSKHCTQCGGPQESDARFCPKCGTAIVVGGQDPLIGTVVAERYLLVEKIGQEVERQTGEAVELSSRVDDGILGGIVLQVGNMVLDASIRSRLEKLRKTVATAAH